MIFPRFLNAFILCNFFLGWMNISGVSFITAQPLTYRGGKEMPAEILLVTSGDFYSGDTIYSAYEFDGQLYASWKQAASGDNFFVRIMADDNDTPVVTGLQANNPDNAVYVLYRNGKFTRLKVEKVSANSYFTKVKMTDTEQEVTLNDNLYYSLCPLWPDIQSVTILTRVQVDTPEPFYKWLKINDIIPKYTSQIFFELATGSGQLYPSTFDAHWKYAFHPDDITRGYIDLLIKVVPLKNCRNCMCERSVRIYLSSP